MHPITSEQQLQAAARQDVDWLSRWWDMVVAEHAQTDRAAAAASSGDGDWWAGQAQRFAAFAQRAPQPDAFLQTLLPHLRPADSVLDIGAGTGRHTSYLARHAAHVVVVEPSAGMRGRLVERLEDEGVTNVTVVTEHWPTEVPPCDLAIAAHVVYAVREIGPFLAAMDAAARRGCFVLAGVHQPSYFVAPFWQQVYNEERLPLPGAVECLGTLRQLGIAARATVLPATPYRFESAAEALADLRWRLHVRPDTPGDKALQNAIADLLVADETGGLVARGAAPTNFALWWVKE